MRTPFSITSRVLCCRVMILSTVRLLVRPSPIWKSPNHLGCSVFSTTAALSRWKQPPKNITEERLAGRREFEAFKTSSATNDDDDDIHLNPLSHQERLYAPQNPSSQENKQSIRVCVLGVPNAGKSTLVNQLVHANVCAHSHKTHTTRKSSRAILTKEDVQVVFSDTPGIVKPGDIKKFKLEDSLIQQPVESVKEADLILVVQGT
jgi:ribosome biogenesis GTPase A